jgi:hypothetical protein
MFRMLRSWLTRWRERKRAQLTDAVAQLRRAVTQLEETLEKKE